MSIRPFRQLSKIFNLPSFLTKRDEWAGTFEHLFEGQTSPRTDCPQTLPNPYTNLPKKPNQENQKIHEFQQSLVHLANGLSGNKDDISSLQKEGEAVRFNYQV